MNHTQEPWIADEFGNILAGNPEYYLCKLDQEPVENAARIVACVNACAGVPDEVLMRQGIDGWIWRHDRDRYAALNAELEANLAQADNACYEYNKQVSEMSAQIAEMVAAVKKFQSCSEECETDDGLGMWALMEDWDELDEAIAKAGGV